MITKKIKYYQYLLIILLSNVIYSQWCPPSIDDNNGVLSFDGTNDFVALPFIFDPNQDFTISFWFKRSDYGSSAKDLILSQADGDSPGETGRSIIAIGDQNGAIPKEIFLETNLTGSEKRLKQGVEINKWTHITLVHDTDGDDGIDKGIFYWYYNGIEHWDGDLIANGVDSNNDGEFYLGKNNSASQFFKGEIDELRIWNATRTFAQIQSDVHNIADTSDASLLAYYDMESISGGTLDNKSSSGATYNGTINGATATNGISNIVNSTSFVYGQVSYTVLEKDPTPTIIGLSGGTFSSNAGLTFISSSSGQIDVSASTPGSYTVTYTAVATSCSSPSSQFVTIVASNTMDLSYSCNTYNIDSGVQSPTLGGGVPTGGYYYSEPKGLFLDKDTGQITTASSTIGDYEVYYSRSATTGTWIQIGSDIDAATGASGDIINQNRNGISVRLNAAGNVLITESPGSDNNGDYSGQARVFYNNNGNWEQIGHNIGGEDAQGATWHGDSSFQVDVNDKGDIIVMTNPLNDSSCTDCGRVIVLKLQNGIWSQLGNEFYGTAASGGEFGLAVSLNAAGDVLAIGDQLNDDAGTNRGAISIYKYEGGSWVAKGSTIYPTQLGSTAHIDNEKWGDAIDLNDAGDILIAGSSEWNSSQGMFKVFKYDGTTWNIYGEPKSGAADSKYGHSVSINAEGNVISIGARKYSSNKGRGYVFLLDETISPNIWRNQQYGGALIDPNTDRSFSWSQNTNELGTVNVMGSPNKNNSTGRNGEVSVWRGIHKDIGGGEIQPSQIQIGGYIPGEGANDRFGWSVDINDEGDIVAIGAPNNEQGGTDAGHVRVYRLVYDNDHKTRAPFNISIQDFDTTISYPASIYDQDDTPITPTLATASGTFTVTPTYGLIHYPNQWGPSGGYFLSIDPTTGVVSPSVSLAGTYSITYTIGCESSTISMTIRSVNDIDHSLTYSPTTVCISGGGTLSPIIIPNNQNVIPRLYFDPGNPLSYTPSSTDIINLTTDSSFSNWYNNEANNSVHHPDYLVHGTELTHNKWRSWSIPGIPAGSITEPTSTIYNSFIGSYITGSNLRRSFPQGSMTVSVWVKESDWTNDTIILDHGVSPSWGREAGQITFYYEDSTPKVRIKNTIYTLGDFLPNNDQWYHIALVRETYGGLNIGSTGILKLYINGQIKHIEYGVSNTQSSGVDGNNNAKGTTAWFRNKSSLSAVNGWGAFDGEAGVVRLFDAPLSTNEIQREFDMFAPRYLTDLFTPSPVGLSINSTTGIIDVASSNAGTYSVTLSWNEPIATTTHSGQTSITIEEDEDPSFGYPENNYCQGTLSLISPTITGVPGGIFSSSPAGLEIDATTGVISPTSSSVATYTIVYTTTGLCSASTSFTLAITDFKNDASFTYPENSYCETTIGTVTPTITGISSGTFTSSPTGLIIDLLTGIITPEGSSVATYTIEYTTPGDCAGTSSFTIAITDFKNDASFTYPENSYCETTIGKVTPTITGTSSGTFTSNPTGLIIDPLTGVITPEGSSVATYTIEYTTPGDCAGTSSFTITITDFKNDASFIYTASSYCINDMSIITPIISNPGGNISSSPPGLSIDLTNGEISPSLSLTGTYTIEYTTPGDCAGTSSFTIIINDVDDSTFIYSSNLFCFNDSSVATPTITTLGGTFTSSPTGLYINPLTGVISPGSSLAGTYSITYTTPITKNLSYSIPQKENLIGHYPLDDNQEDVSGKSYHGTVTSTSNPIGADDRFGNPFSALEFDGDDSIYFGDEMLDEFNGSTRDSFTISIWMRYDYDGEPYNETDFMSLGRYGCENTTRGAIFRAGESGISDFGACSRRGHITGDFSDATWHHYVFRYNKNVGRTVYVDGIPKTVENATRTNMHNIVMHGLTIGGGYQESNLGLDPNSDGYVGFLDDLKIWNTPLTDDEITNLNNDESAPPAIPALGPITLGCVSSKTISITISEKASGTFSYPHEDISLDAEFCSLDADITPTVISTVSGTFSSSPDGLHLDPFTGEIKFNLSSAGNYNISYEMPSDCGSTIISTTLVIKNCEDDSDSDGDGVPDTTELLPPYESDPFDGCNYFFINQHRDFVSPAWAASDCDGDGVTNADELEDNTDPTNACSFKRQSITLPITAIGLDCDGDGVPGNKEEAEDDTDSINSCSLIVGNISLVVSSLEDCDGDGVTNADEGSDKTNPLDGCSFILSRSSKSKTKAWEALDCDGDGVLNGNEETDGTDVFNNCSYYLSSMTINPTKGFDCDGDGVTNWQEIQSFTDPTDECDLDPLTIDFEISKEWFDTDCDGDTFKNSIDVFPFYKLEWFDTDNDLVGNNKDQDDDNDGIIDTEEGDNDLDNDGKSNALDTDSDGDGCPDAIEAGYNDPDNNGILGSGDVQVDLDGKVLSNGGYSQISDNDSNNIYDYLEFGSKVDIITNPNKTYEIYRQSSIEISVTAEAKSTISYQWQLNKNGASISSKSNSWEDINDSQDYVGTKTNKLSILNPQFSMEGWNFRLITYSACYVCGGQTISEPAELIISQLFIPNAFSPDGDGINDTWTIRGGLYNYPNNNLVVFNRWGLKVYEADGYNNNWDGNNKGNTNSGNDSKLPVGTYFYVLDLNGNGKNVKKGFVYLTRLNE